MRKSSRYANGSFIAFAIAIGYASNFLPEQNLLLLSIGLTVFATAYLVLAFRSRSSAIWWDYGLQTLLLALAAITVSTPKSLSALWVIVFVILGFIGMLLAIRAKP